MTEFSRLLPVQSVTQPGTYSNVRSLCNTPETNTIHPILGYSFYGEAKNAKDTNGLKYKTGIDPQSRNTYGYQGGKGMTSDKSGIWDKQIHSTTYKTDNQHGPPL